MTPGLLATADGEVFRGVAVGVDGIRTGEVVFNTSMSGYQEIITDPSYAEQIVVMTAPHIGNYGVSAADAQGSRPWVKGLVARSVTREGWSWRAEGTMSDFLVEHEVVALAGVDTRRLTRHVRSRGSMPAALGVGVSETELRELAARTAPIEGRDLTGMVTCPAPFVVQAPGERRGRVVALDLGIKRDIVRQLSRRGLEVYVMPASVTENEIRALCPDGVLLSNGPGDPEPLAHQIGVVRGLLGDTPIFGVCLGHQVLALALGAKSFKLPFGHHGGNHPVRRLADGRVEITAQNHGFAVDLWPMVPSEPPPRSGVPTPDLLPSRVSTRFGPVVPTHQNLNDGTLEGLHAVDVSAFGVQYHPEAAPGPHDAGYLFEEFLGLMNLPAATV
jgi:carbamoyl-phosphate synthase small subunit